MTKLHITHTKPANEIALEGYCMYQKFQTVVKLEENERAKGTDIAQQQFRDLQTRARDGNSSLEDWNLLLSHLKMLTTSHILKPLL